MSTDALQPSPAQDDRTRVGWALLKSSSLLSIGTVVARVLGMAFSLILAKVFVPVDYGSIRYAITLALLLSAVTQPYGQHVLARFVGATMEDKDKLTKALPNLWALAGVLLALTLVVGSAILLLLGRFDIGIMSMLVGMSVFHTYWGLCRGLGAEGRIVAVSVGSNVVQLVAVAVAIFLLDIRSIVVVTAIFGLSYLLPVALGYLRSPSPVPFDRNQIDRRTLTEIAQFSVPIWGSHAAYVAYNSVVVVMLEQFSGTAAVGIYALANTLGRAFLFVPDAFATLLMPRIAAARSRGTGAQSAESRSDLGRLQTVTLIINAVGLTLFLLTVRWFVSSTFGASYLEGGIGTYTVMAIAMILLGQHSTLTAVLVGRGEARFETVSRLGALAVTALVGWLMIPTHGPVGAALAMLAGAAAGLGYYGVLMIQGRGFGEK